MNDTNFLVGIVKILETPKQDLLNKNIKIIQLRAQFPQVRKNSIVSLKIWGNLANDVINYYKMNDYILIEGYLAIQTNKNRDITFQPKQEIEITVLKIYPFLIK